VKPKLKIEIELTQEEVIYISTCCIQRVVNSAIDAVPDDYEFLQDLVDLGNIMEPLRNRLFNAIFVAKAKVSGGAGAHAEGSP